MPMCKECGEVVGSLEVKDGVCKSCYIEPKEEEKSEVQKIEEMKAEIKKELKMESEQKEIEELEREVIGSSGSIFQMLTFIGIAAAVLYGTGWTLTWGEIPMIEDFYLEKDGLGINVNNLLYGLYNEHRFFNSLIGEWFGFSVAVGALLNMWSSD